MGWYNKNSYRNEEPEKNLGTTYPLYEQVKKTIFVNFEEMVNSFSNLIVAENRTEYKLALWDFKKRFIKFFVQINHKNKLNLLQEKDKSFLVKCYREKVNLNKTNANKIIDISRFLIEELGITAIESVKNNDIDAF